ncbi:hypothetical protein ATM97_07120 [Nocardia sp. MH4]|uniref:hypothetical protein n=1 Tax=Nocardia sp. MH4 TaxID=1768677 RepID=UPI001C4F59AA|nr:hypothetical protein [Nocardia sp. MH4]MBW0270783.1 hypothetical protein [Nocardia sp. MH4]
MGRRGRVRHLGKLATLLRLLREVPDKVERDLSRYHHVRYSDRWRVDAAGVPLLTLREIWVRIVDLPGDSAIAAHENGGTPRWGVSEHLLADIWGALTGQPHAGRPKSPAQRAITAARRRATRQVQARFARRRRAIGTE